MKLASSRSVVFALLASLFFSPLGWGDAPQAAAAPNRIPASPLATTEQEINQRLDGKFLYLRGFYQDNKIEFDVNGKPVGDAHKGSFTLSALQVRKVHATKKTLVIEADRYGLHFFGALPYEDESKPFEKLKVSKKPVEITVQRLVIQPEKKKKPKKGDKKAGAPAAGKTPDPKNDAKNGTKDDVKDDDAEDDEKDDDDSDAAQSQSDSPAAGEPAAATAADAAVTPASKSPQTAPDLTAKAAPAVPGQTAVEPSHDPRQSWMQLTRALDQIFATDLDDSVIPTLPDYWQTYFAAKAGKQLAHTDSGVLHPGSGVVAPKLLSSLDPPSNDYAQKNGIAGMVLLSTVVGESGQPSDIAIVRPIGFGLDEAAVAAVQRAKFRPGMHEGQAAPVAVNLQVMFRIYSNMTRPKPGEVPPPTQESPASAPPTHGNGNGKEVAAVR